MKTVLFTYETPLGTFWIVPEPAGRVQLGVDRRKLRTYSSAKTAARAVAEHATGYEPWDSGSGIVAPAGLANWKRPDPQRGRRKVRKMIE
jgi:hypothetical protein